MGDHLFYTEFIIDFNLLCLLIFFEVLGSIARSEIDVIGFFPTGFLGNSHGAYIRGQMMAMRSMHGTFFDERKISNPTTNIFM